MAKNSDALYSWGAGVDVTQSGVYVTSPSVSGTFPTSPTGSYAAQFAEVGWLDGSSGIVESHSMTNTTKYAWQGGTQVKVLKTDEVRSFQFSCLEENAIVMGLIRPGSTPTSSGGVTTTVVKSGIQSDVRQFAIDLSYDNATKKRLLIPRGEVSAVADTTYTYSDLTVYQLTVSVYFDTGINGFYTELSTVPSVAVS